MNAFVLDTRRTFGKSCILESHTFLSYGFFYWIIIVNHFISCVDIYRVHTNISFLFDHDLFIIAIRSAFSNSAIFSQRNGECVLFLFLVFLFSCSSCGLVVIEPVAWIPLQLSFYVSAIKNQCDKRRYCYMHSVFGVFSCRFASIFFTK